MAKSKKQVGFDSVTDAVLGSRNVRPETIIDYASDREQIHSTLYFVPFGKHVDLKCCHWYWGVQKEVA